MTTDNNLYVRDVPPGTAFYLELPGIQNQNPPKYYRDNDGRFYREVDGEWQSLMIPPGPDNRAYRMHKPTKMYSFRFGLEDSQRLEKLAHSLGQSNSETLRYALSYLEANLPDVLDMLTD